MMTRVLFLSMMPMKGKFEKIKKKQLVIDMKGLKATKKQLKDLVDEARFSVKKAKEDEAAFRDVNGKHKNEAVPKVE